MSEDEAHMALVTFSEWTDTVFKLKDYYQVETMQAAVDTAKYQGRIIHQIVYHLSVRNLGL